jgi:hypothetical protein
MDRVIDMEHDKADMKIDDSATDADVINADLRTILSIFRVPITSERQVKEDMRLVDFMTERRHVDSSWREIAEDMELCRQSLKEQFRDKFGGKEFQSEVKYIQEILHDLGMLSGGGSIYRLAQQDLMAGWFVRMAEKYGTDFLVRRIKKTEMLAV